ncbi:IS256 family transposase [Bradyrhizobium sp. WD16]|uniref:IS256 family transposase n=1 Tax=Bradyrhizobium sp. WD16 TaxID=1521768 RepID=UPI0020A29730|nr:IS256 family transposase [Bradyrhizobium sp. WD16]UTD30000.1 IS256 family transposase [Bradyrhizobium sp. WD16]
MRTKPDATAMVEAAWQTVGESFEHFCLTAGIATLAGMMEEDAERLCGPRHGRSKDKDGHRWGRPTGRLDFHGGTVQVERPRVRRRGGGEMALPSWETARAEGWLSRWAMNLMVLNVSTRRFGRAGRLPEGDAPAERGDSRSKSAVSRRFVELSAARMTEWMSSDLSRLDLLAIQIDGLHITEELVLVAAVGIDSDGGKHPLAVVEGATENAATVQALLDNLSGRGLDPTICRLFIVDGAKALTKAIRQTFGRHTPTQRCQIHKARNIVERLPKHLHAPVRKALRHAGDIDDAARAEQLIKNLARRLEREAPGVAASIFEGLDEILTVTRLGLPPQLRRSLACTNVIENMNGTIRRVCGNVKRWRDASMALRWTAAGMIEAAKGFRRLKAWKQLPVLKVALKAIQARHALEQQKKAA